MIAITKLSLQEATQLMKASEMNFGSKNMAPIMAGYTEDVVVMADYRLSKTLDVVSGDTIVNSWEGTRSDSETGLPMEGRGTEVSHVTPNRKCSYWSATFNVWQVGNPGQLPII